jgi:hypothetical protein
MYEHIECHLCPHLGGMLRQSAGRPVADCAFNDMVLMTCPNYQSTHILVEEPSRSLQLTTRT